MAFYTPTPTSRLTLTTLAPCKRSIQSKKLQSRRANLPGTTRSAPSRLWCPHIARSLAQALPVTRSNYAQSKNPFRPSCPAIAYVLCIDVHERLLTSSLVLLWSRKLQLHYTSRLPSYSNNTAIHTNSNRSVLCTVSVLPTTAIPYHPGLLCSAGSSCCLGIPATASSTRVRRRSMAHPRR
jgi:hypothetical protein